MKSKNCIIISVLCFVSTILWLILMISYSIKTGPIVSIDEAVKSVTNPGWLFYASYTNAIFITILVTILFTCLYRYCKPIHSGLSLIGIIFIPIYSIINLFCYFLQVSIVPLLFLNSGISSHIDILKYIYAQLIQAWDGSAVSILNNFAYAILGISSIAFGVVLLEKKIYAKISGVLLILNAIACFGGIIGIILDINILKMGSVIGGVIFIFALLFLTLMFSKEYNKTD